MSTTEPIIIPIEGDPSDFLKDSKKVTDQLNKIGGATKDAGQVSKKAAISITDLRSAYMIAADAARVAGQVWQATGQEFVNYAEQVKNMSRSLGVSAEETSRLIQVADDVRISYDSLKVAMKKAQKDGVQPNIEGLAKLADQYKAIQSPTERVKFLLDKFGESGLEMGKLMEKGGNGIRKMSNEIDDSLIMTKQGIKDSDEYQESIDDLKDSFYEIQLEIGKNFVPALKDISVQMTNNLAEYDDFRKANGDLAEFMSYPLSTILKWVTGMEETADAVDNEFIPAFEESAGAFDEQKEAVDAAKEALDKYKDMLEEASKANLDMESMSRDIAKNQRQYEEDHKKALDNQIEAQKKLSMVEAEWREAGEANRRLREDVTFAQHDLNEAVAKYGASSDEAAKARRKLDDAMSATSEGDTRIAEAQKEYDEATKSINKLQASWHEAANNMIYDMVLVGLSAGGLLDSEQKALDEYAVKAGIKTQADIDEANRRREIADATINGILQSEDVLAEQRKVDAETLRLTEAQTSAEKIAASEKEAAAINMVTLHTQQEIREQQRLTMAAQRTAQAYAAIKYPGMSTGKPYIAPKGTYGGKSPDERDSGGVGIAGTPYMIGTGAQPEIFIPSTNGTFIPNADKKGLGGATYNIYITNPKREAVEDSVRSALRNLVYTGSAA